MFDTSTQLTRFHNYEVTLSSEDRTTMKKRRNANRTRLKDGLKKNENPSPLGCHTQGSYAMKTMVQDSENDYDIDDGVYFEKDDLYGPKGGELSPLQVRQMVCEALAISNQFKTPPEVLKNCVRVYYSEGHHIDVPAYRSVTVEHWWTGNTETHYELASSSWKRSDPREVTNWFKAKNQELSPDSPTNNGGQFRRVVRLLKKFSKSRSSWKSSTASGFMLTKLAEETFYSSLGRDDIALRQTMENIRQRLVWSEKVDHPVLEGERLTNDSDGRPGFLRDKLQENLKHLDILDDESCTFMQAMKAWDKVFNTTWFSDQTEEGSDGTGAAKTPNKAVKKKGGGRYAGSLKS